MTEEEKQAIALFKYSLIAPLVAGSCMEVSKAEYYRVTAEKEYTFPTGEKTHYSVGTFSHLTRHQLSHTLYHKTPTFFHHE